MLKNFLKILSLSSVLFINHALALTTNTNNFDSLTVQLENVTLMQFVKLPKHDFSYRMTIPNSEISKGAPLAGLLHYYTPSISTVFYRPDQKNIEVNLDITDPAIGNRNIWKGKIIYNKTSDKVELIPEKFDDLHYKITIDITQPNQGHPQFAMKIICF